jgi:hypothetical protein
LSQLQARNAKPVDWAQASEQEENVRYANTPQIKLRHQILSHLKEAERLKGQLQALQAQKNPAAAGMADSVLQRLMAHEQAAERLQAAQAKLPPLPGTDIGTRGHMSLMTEAEKKLPSQNAAQNRAQMLADIPMYDGGPPRRGTSPEANRHFFRTNSGIPRRTSPKLYVGP